MKRLIVCSDGTWNNPKQEENGVPAPTNVFKIFNAIADKDSQSGSQQLKYYHPGVGGDVKGFKKILGGAVGVGISRHIRSAYHWLGMNYTKGDQIFLFGFSRGAFTARSLSGFLGRGLLNLRNLEPAEAWKRVNLAYEKGYRSTKAKDKNWAKPGWKFFHQRKAVPIHFVGVWDTVGALGIPDDLEILNFFEKKAKWEFHDTKLGKHNKTARHAMAIDEVRSSFTVTRWSDAAKHPDAKELWFPGVHSDVGGGYEKTDLSDGALVWMMEEAKKAALKFRPGVQASIQPDPTGVIHNSFKGAFAKLRSRPRNLPLMTRNNPAFHKSAFKRQSVSPIAHLPYHPVRTLRLGQTHTVDVFADTRWNYAGLYLPAGQSYTFSATGEWLDSKDACDWKGTQNDEFTKGDVVRAAGSFLGKFEKLFKKLKKNKSTDFLGTKRIEELPWFIMIGAITNDAESSKAVAHDGSPVQHQYVDLPAHETEPLKIAKPGYLYCFPNDVWSLYDNNHGSVQLTIKRVS